MSNFAMFTVVEQQTSQFEHHFVVETCQQDHHPTNNNVKRRQRDLSTIPAQTSEMNDYSQVILSSSIDRHPVFVSVMSDACIAA